MIDSHSLTPRDLSMFEKIGVGPKLLAKAKVKRVDDGEARELLALNGHFGDMAGVVFPYNSPQTGRRVSARLRRDHPEIEDGEEKNKYLAAYGDRRHLYFTPNAMDALADPTVPIVLVEAEKSALALCAWSERTGKKILPVAMGGCWGWRGRIGKVENANGERVDETGPLPELHYCANRLTYVLLDANCATNPKVQGARKALAANLTKIGAKVLILDLPGGDGINGPDDFLAVRGDEALAELFDSASPEPASELDRPYGFHLTSMGNAERFLRDCREDILWVEGSTLNSSGTFYCWEGQRWQPDNRKAMLLAKETVSNLKQLVSTAIEANQKSDAIKGLVSFWRSCENDHKVSEILSLARWDVAIKQGKFDSDPDLLGVKNGAIDLRTGVFRKASRADYITKQTNVVFDERATCPLWEEFLLDTTQGNHELVAYLGQCVGISLTGHTKEHLFFIVVGPGGTGKSTFFETIKYVWGDYAVGIDPNSIAASMKAEGGRARPDIARLPGVRLAFANETRKGLQLDAGLIKALTGGDTVQARHLYQAEFDFKPTHKLWLRTNEEPQFDGADTGMQRRVKKIPFVNEIKKTKPEDPDLPEKLRGEAAGILNWALRGLLAYQKYSLTEPTIITTETAEYIKSLDILAQFIEEQCDVGPTYRQPANKLYQQYRTWIENRGQKAVGSPRFRADLQAKGFKQEEDRSGIKIWYRILLKASD